MRPTSNSASEPPAARQVETPPSGLWSRWTAALREQVTFARALLRSPGTVGAVCPSSRALGRAMIAGSNLREAGLVVELGPGTGAFTRVIAAELGLATEFFALELDADAVRHLRRRFPQLKVFQDPAERIRHHLARLGRSHADYVISGLPWAILPEEVQQRTMDGVAESLAPGGVFTTFAYLHARGSRAATRYWQRLPSLFSRVEVSAPVWWNLPPAVVYRCVK